MSVSKLTIIKQPAAQGGGSGSYLPLSGGTMTGDSGTHNVDVIPEVDQSGAASVRNTSASGGARLGIWATAGTPELRGQRSAGSWASPSALASGATMLRLLGYGRQTTTWANGPMIQMQATEAWSDTITGSRITFLVTPTGTQSQAEKMRITGSSVQIGGTYTDTPAAVERLRVNTPTTPDTTAAVHLAASATTTKPLVVQGIASQAAALSEWQSSAGAVLASVSAAGLITAAGFNNTAKPTGWGTPTGTLERTTFDVATITAEQVARRLAALITDLKSANVIGA